MMQASQPATTAPPAPAVKPQVRVFENGGAGPILYSARDVEMLRARRSELSHQLTSADGRRRALQKSLQGATGADKTGLEQRLAVLDARIARIETDIEENGRALASPAALAGTEEPSFGSTIVGGRFMGLDVTPLLMVLSLVVLAPVGFGLGRRLWRRNAPPPLGASNDTAQRLERMEHAMDAIALEVERVSEGQRFVTRLLAEGRIEAQHVPDPGIREPARLRSGEPS